MNKPGRPKLPPSKNKSKLLQVRLTPMEHKKIAKAAEACGQTPSDWARVNLRAVQFYQGMLECLATELANGQLDGVDVKSAAIVRKRIKVLADI
jgi:hypothetical protein